MGRSPRGASPGLPGFCAAAPAGAQVLATSHAPPAAPAHLLAAAHAQTQVLQHQLQAGPVAHGVVPELHLALQGPARRRAAALHHPRGLGTKGRGVCIRVHLFPSLPSPACQSASLLRPPPSSPIGVPGAESLASPVAQPCGSMNPLSLPLFPTEL